jgi:hypothetical protein
VCLPTGRLIIRVSLYLCCRFLTFCYLAVLYRCPCVSPQASHNAGTFIFVLQVPTILLPGCVRSMFVCLPTGRLIMQVFVLQVPNILLPGSLELLAAAVSRYTESRLADGLRAPPHLCHRHTQHCYLSLLLLLLPCSLQGHPGLRGKLEIRTFYIVVGAAARL